MRKKEKDRDYEKIATEYQSIEIEDVELTSKQAKMRKHFSQLGDPCKRLLTFSYFWGLDIIDITSLG